MPPAIAWAAGLLLVFGPGLGSGFRRILGGLGDVRLIHYTLEHGYRWLTREPLHREFWSPPIFYPHPGVGAYTDVLLGVGPFYWPLRWLGFAPDVAFHLWVLLTWSLNFAVCWWLLRRSFGLRSSGAAAGAFLFAFGAWRQLNVFHQQLIPNFYLLLSIAALAALFRDPSAAPETPRGRRAWGWIGLFYAGLALQAWTAFYPRYFFARTLGAALIWALAMAGTRRRLAAQLSRHGIAWLLCGLLAAAAVYPLAARYAAAATEVGLRTYPREKVPRPASWVLMGQTHRLYGWLQDEGGPARELRSATHSNGLGPATTLIAAAGLWSLRRRPGARLVVLSVLTVALVATSFPGGWSGWKWIHAYLPGAAALRAVGRIGIILLLPAALGVGAFFQRRHGRSLVLTLLLGAVFLAEQLHTIEWRDRDALRAHLASIASRIEPDCQAFFLVAVGPKRYTTVEEDAAWVSLATGVPTINGRYGNRPPGWGMNQSYISRPKRRLRLLKKLDRWCQRYGLERERVCWVEIRGLD